MISIFTTLNLPITWITQAGLKIRYSNVKFESIRVKANLLHTSYTTTIKLPNERLYWKLKDHFCLIFKIL